MRVLIAFVPLALCCSAPADRGLTRPDAVPETPFAQQDVVVDELRLRTLDEGPRGAETVLILPGHTARLEGYDSIVPHLAHRRRVLLPDLPGKGYSDKPDRPYTFTFYEDVVIGYLDLLGIDRVHLAGGSLGGNLALRLAHRFPDRVDRVAAWGPGGVWKARPWLASGIRAVGSYPLFWPVIRRHSQYWYRDDNPERERLLDETYAHYREVMGPGFVRMYFDMAAASVGNSLFAIAPEIEQPVLLLRGAEDEAVGMATGIRELEQLLPHATLIEIPDARHALTTEAPEALGRAIEEFLDDATPVRE